MMKNIRVHKFLVLFFLSKSLTASISHVEIFLKELSGDDAYWLEQAWEQYKEVPILIKIDPNVFTHQEIKFIQKKSLLSKASSISTQDAVWWALQTCFGCGTVSYLTVAYFIYRVYKIALKLHGISQWLQGDNNEEETTDTIEKFLFKKTHSISYDERIELRRYSKVNDFLKQYGIRNYFFYDKELDQLIEQYNQLDKEET